MMDKPRILLIPGPQPNPDGVLSGVERYLAELVSGLGDSAVVNSYEPEFYKNKRVRQADIALGERSSADVKVAKVNRSINIIPKSIRLVFGLVKETLGMALELRKNRKGNDLIHCNRVGCEYETIAARLAGFKHIVATIHNLPGDGRVAFHPVRRVLESLSFASCHRCIAICDTMGSEWEARTRSSRGKMCVIKNGLTPPNVSHDRLDAARLRYQKNRKGIHIGCCARLHPMKGHSVLVDAFTDVISKLSDSNCMTLHLAGDGSCMKSLRDQIDKNSMQDHILLHGQVEDPLAFIGIMNLSVLPSVSLEGLPYSVIESMFMGVPVLATDIGGAKEIIRESGGGRIVPAADCSALSSAIYDYAKSPDLLKNDGVSAKKYAEQELTADCMASKTLDLYRELLS